MEKWTARMVEDRLEEAALTLRRLPPPVNSGAKGYGSSWPDYVREARHAYGYNEARVRIVPSAEEIQRMDEALQWLSLVSNPDDRRILWLRAEGRRWRQVCYSVGLTRATCWRRWVAGLQTVAGALNAKRPRSVARPSQ